MVEPHEINWQELSFAYTPTKYMFIARCGADQKWQEGEVVPYQDIPMSPAACVLNYGQGLFEGLKAFSGKDDKIYLFRPEENAMRISEGCERLCVPPLPVEIFLNGISEIARANREYVPPFREESFSQGSLYIRPVIWGTGPILGVAPAPSYTFVIFACPVGAYFKKGFQAIKLKVTTEYFRATKGGTGYIKAIGNYATGMLPAQIAKKEGFQEILYLDTKECKYIEEVGAANFFCYLNGTLVTPELDGRILPGITRSSILELAQKRLGLKVEERKVSLEEVFQSEEAFSTGTAAVVSPVGSIFYKGKEHLINGGEPGPLTKKLFEILVNIQHGFDPDHYGWSQEVCQR